jgi:hypothetical protein
MKAYRLFDGLPCAAALRALVGRHDAASPIGKSAPRSALDASASRLDTNLRRAA